MYGEVIVVIILCITGYMYINIDIYIFHIGILIVFYMYDFESFWEDISFAKICTETFHLLVFTKKVVRNYIFKNCNIKISVLVGEN